MNVGYKTQLLLSCISPQ